MRSYCLGARFDETPGLLPLEAASGSSLHGFVEAGRKRKGSYGLCVLIMALGLDLCGGGLGREE